MPKSLKMHLEFDGSPKRILSLDGGGVRGVLTLGMLSVLETGRCQSNANQSPQFADEQVLGDEKVAPLAKVGVAFLFEADSRVDVPFQIEVIVH